MVSRRFCWALGLVLLGGCCQLSPDHSDDVVAGLASRVRDVEPPLPADSSSASPSAQPVRQACLSLEADAPDDPPVRRVAAVQLDRTLPPEPARRPLDIPPGLPGGNAPPIRVPEGERARERALQELYPSPPPLPPDLHPAPGPDGQPLTLSDLQTLATANNPSVKNAVAAVEAARGALLQAAAYPNPTVSWEADTVGTAGAGYQGAYFDQPFKGANKIQLLRAQARMDLANAEAALRRAQSDLATQVRSNYFAVLVALENVRVNRALAEFDDKIYRIQVVLLDKGFAAAYEPMQLHPIVLQARFNLLQARNQYQASWRQLAAALGKPGLPPMGLAGRVDLPVPVFHYDAVLAKVVNGHTDVRAAQNSLQKARYALELARVMPYPDYDVRLLVQKDYTTPPHLIVYSTNFTFTLPVWDQNRGNIKQAENQLVQAQLQPEQTRLQLTSTLADAYNRYETAREQVQISLRQIEDQVRAYRALYERRQQQPNAVSFGDLVTAQQTLVTYISGYITALGLQWTAVVDVANLLQTDDLWGMCPNEEVAPVPNLEHLFHVPGPPQTLPSAPGLPIPPLELLRK
jgi:cobalt-zinc-cadmium efflux system outer membrane protein